MILDVELVSVLLVDELVLDPPLLVLLLVVVLFTQNPFSLVYGG